MCYESDSLSNYLRVFRLIFQKMGHISHYDMMMDGTEEANPNNGKMISDVVLGDVADPDSLRLASMHRHRHSFYAEHE